MRIISSALSGTIDWFLPCRCPLCGVIVGEDHRFCLPCWQMLDFTTEPWCASCGIPFAYEHSVDSICGNCLVSPPEHDGVRSVVAYDSNSAKIAMGLKYSAKLGFADLIAGHLERYLDGIHDKTLFVPVPLHRRRLWERGFNQSVLIAKSLSRRSGIQLCNNILIRNTATPPLKSMTVDKRSRLVRNAISLSKSAERDVAGRTVLLIDDVYTTGATTNACARLLKLAGANSVIVMCWARVLPDSEQ